MPKMRLTAYLKTGPTANSDSAWRPSLGEICDTVAPPWQEAGAHHRIRCHIPLSPLAAMPHWPGRRDMS
jgi:hypothetical protein